VTENDARRIHERLDEIICVMGDQAVSIAKLNTSFENMLTATAKAEVTREQTCPHNAAMSRLQRHVDALDSNIQVIKWFGGIVTVGLLIPGIHWFGQRLWLLILG
jgi:hypothetical protein